MSCLDEETIAGCVEGRLSAQERSVALAHADECEPCCELLSLTARELLSSNGQDADPDSAPRGGTETSPGYAVGHYRVLERIGAGAMGEVFAAFDPRLGRKVALKVLRMDLTAPVAAAQQARLVLEAQALARITHPNVVSVYEVGLVEGHIFIAMELVDGPTLSGWLAAQPRTWRQILDVFVAAGRGLAAVHAAGMVHRDFKPDNVLIGSDGRVRVTDFGLARVAATDEDELARFPLAPEVGAAEFGKITRQGTLLGTPAYMAPEQLRGEPATPASDQFGFCVALFEAFSAQRPFVGSSVDELRKAQAQRPPSPRRWRAPGFAQSAIRRGLSLEPADRYASMDALLARFATGVRRPAQLRRLALLLATTSAMALAAWPLWHRAMCPRLDATWSAARQSRLAAAFSASGIPAAPMVWRAVVPALERFAAAWRERQAELCSVSAYSPLHDSAQACLQSLQVELSAVLASYEKPDATVVKHAQSVAESLTPVDRCRNPRAQHGAPAPLRAAIEKQLAEIKVDEAYDRYSVAIPLAAAAVAQAHAIGDRLLEARALLYQGRLLLNGSGDAKRAESILFEAYTAASEAGDDEVAAQAGIQEMFALGERLGKVDEAKRWTQLTSALVKRVGDPDLQATFDDSASSLQIEWGQFDAAIVGLERALATHRRLHGEQGFSVVRDEFNLGMAFYLKDDPDHAAEMYGKALPLALKLFGPNNPDVAGIYNGLGLVASRRGRYKEARELLERAVAIRRATLAHDHPDLGSSLVSLAEVLIASDKKAALADLDEAIAIGQKRLGPDNEMLAMWIDTRGDVLLAMNRLDEAMASYQRSIEMIGRSPNRDAAAIPSIGVGQVELARGQPAKAVAPLTRAVAVFDVHPRTNLTGLATARFNLGKALWGTGERARGRKMVEAGRDDFAAAGLGPEDDSQAETKRWLAKHKL